jgi:hypothetical protein
VNIIGFAQLRNELSKNNLINWFKSMNTICDKIYIYDQNSTDGSLDFYKNFDNVHVITSNINNFSNEILCKQELLQLLQDNEGYDNWIFWMDGDTILEKNANKINIKNMILKQQESFIKFRHYNLWRSETYYRLDQGFHNFWHKGVVCLWKNSINLQFDLTPGLHKKQYPGQKNFLNDNSIMKEVSFIHRGFIRDDLLVKKYYNYRHNFGQTDLATENFFMNENNLIVEELPDIYPDWLIPQDTTNPKNKIKFYDYYNSTSLEERA